MRNVKPLFSILPFAVLVFASCGGGIEPRESEGWSVGYESEEPSVAPTTPGQPVAGPKLYECELETVHDEMTYWVDPVFASFSQNGGLFVAAAGYGGSATTIAVEDGTAFPGGPLAGLRAVDAQWRRALVGEPYGQLRVRSLPGGEPVWEWAGDRPIVASGLSPDGRTVALTTCDQEATTLELYDIDAGTRRSLSLDVSQCYGWGPVLRQAAFTSDSRYLVLGVEAQLMSIDLDTLDVTTIEPHVDPNPEEWYQTVIAAIAVRPGAHEVVTTGVDGRLRRWALPGLEQVGEEREVGVFRINEMTYAPTYDVSPVAFSADGRTLAFVDLDGNIVVSNAAGESVLPSPPQPPETMEWMVTPNVPVMIAFSGAGDRIGVGYYYGPAVWGCPGGTVQSDSELDLEVRAPRTAAMNGEVAVPVEIRSDEPMSALRVTTADGQPYGFWYADGAVRFWPSEPGRLELVIEAHDGSRAESVAFAIEIVEAH